MSEEITGESNFCQLGEDKRLPPTEASLAEAELVAGCVQRYQRALQI